MLTNKTEYQFPAGGTEKLNSRRLSSEVVWQDCFVRMGIRKAGLRPVVYERGEKASERKKTVDQYWKDGILNPKQQCAVR